MGGAWVVLAYHRPGSPRGVAHVESMASRLSARLGVTVRAEEIEEAPAACREGGLVAALLPARGGHLASLESEAAARGCRLAGPVPARVLAAYLAEAARLGGRGCGGRVYLAYWRAKRYTRLQEADLARAARLAESEAGLRVGLAAYEPPLPPRPPLGGACAAVASMLPGRLPGILAAAGWRVIGEYVLASVAARRVVEEWVALEAGRLAR